MAPHQDLAVTMMKPILIFSVLFAGTLASSAALADEMCMPLPSAVQSVSVSYISQSSELQKLEEQLDAYLQPCLKPITPANRKTSCANGRVVAEQVLRVIGRIDEAGKKNAFLSNVKMKSYKTAVALQDYMKKAVADKTCS
jgi:hypothetical protein